MNIQEIYKELNNKLGLADSQFLNDVWKILCTDDEVLIANTLPGSLEDIAQKKDRKSLFWPVFITGSVLCVNVFQDTTC